MTDDNRGLWQAFRPYLAVGPVVKPLVLGSYALARGALCKCFEGEGWDKLWRLLGLALAVGTGSRIVGRVPMLMVPVTVVWLVAAWRGAPDKDKNKAVDEQETERGQDEGEKPEREPLLHVYELAGACHEVGAPHAHFAALALHLDTTAERVRESCRAAGIPTSTVRMKGRGVSTGIKAEHFPPLPSPEEAAVVGMEVRERGANNNKSTRWFKNGTRITTWPDEERPYRTNVRIEKGRR